MPAISEFDIQRALCIFLDGFKDKRTGAVIVPPAILPDVVWWHTPNGGARGGLEAKRFKESGVKAGIYDLTFLRLGRFWVLELKDEKGTLSDAQRDMWRRYEGAGAAGIAMANSLDAAKRQLFAWVLTSRC